MAEENESVRKSFKKSIDRVVCRAYLSSNQADLVDGVWTKVNLNSVTYDLGGNFDTSSNYRFDAPVSGLYQVLGKIDLINTIANKNYAVSIYVNGSSVVHAHTNIGAATDEVDVEVNDLIFLNKDDYVELYAQSNAGVNTVDIDSDSEHTFLVVRLVNREGIRA